jgi:hypothetical protein
MATEACFKRRTAMPTLQANLEERVQQCLLEGSCKNRSAAVEGAVQSQQGRQSIHCLQTKHIKEKVSARNDHPPPLVMHH